MATLLKWSNLCYQTTGDIVLNYCPSNLTRLLDLNHHQKQILTNLNGSLKSGQLMAMVGPSGAGKTTLLECLADFRNTGELTGRVSRAHHDLRSLAYVSDCETFYDTLTIRESLSFSAKLASPGGESTFDVDPLIKQLGLEAFVDVRAGKLSGGQRKRLAIGLTLTTSPSVLLLDEPTSGLDSVTSEHLVELLRHLVDNKSCLSIFVTIHQPSRNLLLIFDQIYALSFNGHCIYNRPPGDIVKALASQTNESLNENPAELLLKIASVGGKPIENEPCDHDVLEPPLTQENYQSMSWLSMLVIVQTLIIRQWLSTWRQPIFWVSEFIAPVMVAIFYGYLIGSVVANQHGCPLKLNTDWTVDNVIRAKSEILKSRVMVLESTAIMIFVVLTTALMTTLSPVMFYRNTLQVVRHEMKTYGVWLSVLSHDIACLPMTIVKVTILIGLTNTFIGIYTDSSRLGTAILVICLFCVIFYEWTLIFHVVLWKAPGVATALALVFQIMLLMVAGHMIHTDYLDREDTIGFTILRN